MNPYRTFASVMAYVIYGLAGLSAVLTLTVGVIHESLTESLLAVPILVAGAFFGSVMLLTGEIIRLLDKA